MMEVSNVQHFDIGVGQVENVEVVELSFVIYINEVMEVVV